MRMWPLGTWDWCNCRPINRHPAHSWQSWLRCLQLKVPPPPSSSATPESNYISAKPCFDVWWPTSTRERTYVEGERVREREAYVSAAEARVDDDKRIRNTMRRVTSPPHSSLIANLFNYLTRERETGKSSPLLFTSCMFFIFRSLTPPTWREGRKRERGERDFNELSYCVVAYLPIQL